MTQPVEPVKDDDSSGTAGERYADTKRALHEQLRMLQESYRQAAAPIVSRLVELDNRYPPPIFISRAFDPLTKHWLEAPAVTSPSDTRSKLADEPSNSPQSDTGGVK